ncbi:MAG TPA: MFS transporter [Thermoleophilia bacterium]|nr:MFS transporter [Thermoleophilia bacterium]
MKHVQYKWIALSNTTLGIVMAMINASSLLIALPAIFRGIHLNPLDPNNFVYLLWILMGYGLVTAVLVVLFGRLGDMYGRVRMYNAGFVIFTLAAVALSLTWGTGPAGAMQIIVFRMVQAVGGAMLMSNSAAILTDAFPHDERGMALGINIVGGLSGSFVGLILGGVLAAVDWRLVFLINVPFGVIGTVWAFLMLRETGARTKARIDWLGNVTFAVGLLMLLVGVTYGIKPYGTSNMGWGSPFVLVMSGGGVLMLALFAYIELHVADPMFELRLFKIRAFAAGNLAVLLSSIANGGLQFMLIMWLQGIWLPLHGYDFKDTPLWAGIYMLPLTVGFLVAGPISGHLSDRHGARPFATAGMLLAALSFVLFMVLPANFAYPWFAAVLLLNGLAFGMFAAPNTAAIMNSVPARNRGVASGMRATMQAVGLPLSIGVFFSLMVVGLSASVPHTMFTGLTSHQVPANVATGLSHLPPTGYLFAAFLGYNPLQQLLGAHLLGALPHLDSLALVGKEFFPSLISHPFRHGLIYVLTFAAVMCLIAALASWLRGGKFVHEEAHGHAGQKV